MSAADARAQLEDAIRRAMDSAAECRAHAGCPRCEGNLNVAMTAATVYAEQYAAHATEKALQPYRLRDATAEHSPRGGRAS